MKVEFTYDDNNGYQIVILYNEFIKADKDDDEFNSFAYATDCFFTKNGNKGLFIDRADYNEIKKDLKKGEAVIITVLSTGNFNEYTAKVFVTNNFQRRVVNTKEFVWRSY